MGGHKTCGSLVEGVGSAIVGHWVGYMDPCWGANKVRSPIPWVYGGFYTVYYKDVGEFQILYSQDICW
jgi:hypothetical protein